MTLVKRTIQVELNSLSKYEVSRHVVHTSECVKPMRIQMGICM